MKGVTSLHPEPQVWMAEAGHRWGHDEEADQARAVRPLWLLVSPDYGIPTDVLEVFVELKPFLSMQFVALFFHHERSVDASVVRERIEDARKVAGLGASDVILAVGDAHADSTRLAAAAVFGGATSPIGDKLGLRRLQGRYGVEGWCVDQGLLPRVVRDSFCPQPFWHLHVEADGLVTPCCIARVPDQTPSLADHPLPVAFNNEVMRRVRLNMLDGRRDVACIQCWDREHRRESSGRVMAIRSTLQHQSRDGASDPVAKMIGDARRITEDDGEILEHNIVPRSIDIRWSNLCNFKCRTCFHRSSSAWFEDAERIAQEIDDGRDLSPEQSARRYLLWGTEPVLTFNAGGQALAKLAPHLGQVVSIYAAGGEPLMMDEHFAMLETFVHRASEIELSYNTNLSKLDHRGRDLLEIWKPFKKVHLGLSVDGIREVGEYVRTGFRTNRFVSNLLRIRDASRNGRLSYHLAVTVSVYNVFHLPDFLREALEEHWIQRPQQAIFQVVQLPLSASSSTLPHAERERAASMWDELATEWQRGYGPTPNHASVVAVSLRAADDALFALHRETVWTNLERLDRLRGTSFREIVPHMSCYAPGA